MYQGYLDAHDSLVAGTMPSEIAELAEFSARMDEATVFYVQALDLELRGRAAIERFMVESRQSRMVGRLSGADQRRLAGASVGVLLSKSIQLSSDVYLAMLSRGFRGEIYTLDDFQMIRAQARDREACGREYPGDSFGGSKIYWKDASYFASARARQDADYRRID